MSVLLAGSAIVIPSLLCSGAASGQELAEVIVTAQRRDQAVIDVPISVSVLAGQKVEDRNLSTFTSIAQQTPNFNVTFSRGANATPDLSIRGVRGEGSNGRVNESSVAVYVDDVYLGDESSLSGQIFDVQRVEVLRGPQGTLFGRNTTGGLVQFISAAPTADFSGDGSVLYGSDNWVSLNGAVSGPLSKNIRSRLAGQFEQYDGHYTNRATLPGAPKKLGGKNVWSIRSTTDFDIGSASTLRLQATRSETDSESQPNYGLGIWKNQPGPRVLCSRSEILAAQCADALVLGGQPPQNGRRAGDAVTELSHHELEVVQNLTSLTAKFETDLNWATLINVANYSQFKSRIGLDGDAGSTPSTLGTRVLVQLHNSTKQFSEELRLQGETDALNWVAGFYYYQDRKENSNVLNVRNNAGVNIVQTPSNSRVDTKSGAAFGQVDWRFADQWTLSVGARYTIENRELIEARLAAIDVLAAVDDPDPVTRDVTGRVSLTWEPTSDNSLYGSYSRGAKSVSYSTFYTSGTAESNAALTGPVGQEHVDAFEIGSKNRLLNRTLMLNLAAFYYFFDGKQDLVAVADTSGPVPILSTRFLNLGKAEIYGAELELSYVPNRHWDLAFTGGLLETEITKSPVVFNSPRLGLISLEGRPLPQTPKWNVNGTFAYHIPTDQTGVFTLQAEGRAQAKQNFGLSNDPLVDVPSYGVVNFRVLWKSDDGKYNAQLFVTNAFNKAYFNRINDTNVAQGSLITQQAEPRLWGGKIGASF
jgi:iron complex outermembrane receptor protein